MVLCVLCRPVVLCAPETWTLRKVEQTRLATFERKVPRRPYVPCIDSDAGEWRIDHSWSRRSDMVLIFSSLRIHHNDE